LAKFELLVEAKKFVLKKGTWDEWSQWCYRLLRTDGPVAGFVLEKGKANRGKEVMNRRYATEESQGKGPDACW